jgi:hypothetical protein
MLRGVGVRADESVAVRRSSRPCPASGEPRTVKLDRLARSTRHLVTRAAELEALRVDLVVLDQAIDTTTPSGRLLFHVLASIAEFERGSLPKT